MSEFQAHHQEEPKHTALTRITSSFIDGVRFVRGQLATADLNIGEASLRGSLMPTELMSIPDFAPPEESPAS